MRRECREHFPRHHGLAIPTCFTASARRTCRDGCWDRYLAGSFLFEIGGGVNVPGIPGVCATLNFTYLVRGPWSNSPHKWNLPCCQCIETWGYIWQNGNFIYEGLSLSYLTKWSSRSITNNDNSMIILRSLSIFVLQFVTSSIMSTRIAVSSTDENITVSNLNLTTPLFIAKCTDDPPYAIPRVLVSLFTTVSFFITVGNGLVIAAVARFQFLQTPTNVFVAGLASFDFSLGFLDWSTVVQLIQPGGGGGCFKNTYDLLNLRALKFSPVNKIHIFQCMGKIFCVEFQWVPLKFHTKYLTHTLKDTIFMQNWNFKSS